ncbi:GntR family transcriptional regulator [Metabacillus dongyingensis]|uniref:GntR family transcriptional regulator n=1 Tax=Metabacillus dongyingensis TaxID=2874282 RepID=UPI003B8CC0B9
MIFKKSPFPNYHQLQKIIKKAILAQEVKPGEMIPSEREYAETYCISKMTVRQALSNLVDEGYLYRVRGKGTFVAPMKMEQPKAIIGFSEHTFSKGMKPETSVITFKEINSSLELAEKLNVARGAILYELHRLRLVDELVIGFERLYIPKDLAPNLTLKQSAASICEYMEKKVGLTIQKGSEIIEASTANKRDSVVLNIEEGSPVLKIERRSMLGSCTPFELAKSVYRADRYQYKIDMERQKNTI